MDVSNPDGSVGSVNDVEVGFPEETRHRASPPAGLVPCPANLATWKRWSDDVFGMLGGAPNSLFYLGSQVLGARLDWCGKDYHVTPRGAPLLGFSLES